MKTIKAVTDMHKQFVCLISGGRHTRMAQCDSFPGNKHQAKIRQAYTGMSIMDHWSRFSAHADCTLHVLLLAYQAVCCCPGIKEI